MLKLPQGEPGPVVILRTCIIPSDTIPMPFEHKVCLVFHIAWTGSSFLDYEFWILKCKRDFVLKLDILLILQDSADILIQENVICTHTHT